MNPQLGQALRRVFSQPAFVVAAGILLIAAVSLNATAQFMRLHFQKQPVPLAKQVQEIPSVLGPWVQVTTDAAIDPETEQVLGTKDYIFRFYVDRRRVAPNVIDAFKDRSLPQQRAMVERIQQQDAQAVVYAAVTYYTGMVDTVAHIPDRCYVADGYEPTRTDHVRWSALRNRPGEGHLNFINFEDQTPERRAVTKHVAYFFHANGEYVGDPLGVRKKLQNLWESHGYYAKIELLMMTSDREGAAEQMNDFLVSALPEIEKCLPDWEKVKAEAAVK